MSSTRARDRHGRGIRGPMAWPPVPAMGTRREEFDDVVRAAAARLRPILGERYAAVEFAVEDVPLFDPEPWQEQVAPLGKLFHPRGGLPHRIVVYRRPIESRAADAGDLADLVREVLVDQVAALLGVAPEDIDPRA